jgi:FBP C-terminal treble-clef zinc-finger
VEPADEATLRRSFVNCSKGEMAKINLPVPLSAIAWNDLDFLGWRDPKAPERGYVITPYGDGLVGITLRAAGKSSKSLLKSSMCSMCMTVHASSGVTLFTAPLAGPSGRAGNTVGNYMCANLQCSRYLRGELKSEALVVPTESLDLAARIERLHSKLDPFITRILSS